MKMADSSDKTADFIFLCNLRVLIQYGKVFFEYGNEIIQYASG